ncbi:MAG TPA: STAS domain-containing protein [Tepidisphaeraceae bacterium]|jgi:ABC-type transporter Mla MlaB component
MFAAVAVTPVHHVASEAIALQASYFAHREACRVCDRVRKVRETQTVVIDMSHVREATTSAFAKLVLLRRELRKNGRDLVITGLHDRALRLYEISRLDSVLPHR